MSKLPSVEEMPKLCLSSLLFAYQRSHYYSTLTEMDLGDTITKHVKPLSLTTIAAAATVVSILGYSYSRSSKKTTAGEYREIPLAKGWIPYFGNFSKFGHSFIARILNESTGHLWTYVFSGDIVAMAMARRNVDMGPILRFYMGPKPWIVISDPDMVHELLNVHGVSTSHRPKHSYGTRLQSQDHGLTFIDPGSRWKKVRAACECFKYMSSSCCGLIFSSHPVSLNQK